MKRLLRIAAALLGAAGLVCLGIYFFRGGGGGKLTWSDPTVRKSIMTFAYKVYADPSIENGRFFLSKIVFHNDGTGPVRDLSISYQIPDYYPWTTPETQSELPAGQTWVALHYPQLPAKVTQLSNRANATLETKIRWIDSGNEQKEEVLRSNVLLHGVNEIEYTDLPNEEILGWADQENLSEFAVAMVTPNDPVVKEFAAEITRRTGGTMAGVDQTEESIAGLMKATYDYMCETGMRYTSDEGVPGKLGVASTQTVRMPRDVILANEGLCVELAILWSSVMQHLGCHTSLVFLPRHAFMVTWIGNSENYIPMECTAITPMAIKSWLKPLGLSEDTTNVPFEKAVVMANHELNELKESNSWYVLFKVEDYRRMGFEAPELPSMEIDKIKNILAQRTAHTAASYAQNAGRGEGKTAANNGQVRQGYYRWTGVNNTVSIDVPETWARTENTAIPGIIFVAQDAQTSVGATVFSFPGVSNPAQAMELTQQGLSHAAGARVKVASHEYKGNSIVYTGNTVYQNGSTAEWVGWFVPSQSGVVGLFVGAIKGQFQRNQSIIRDIVSSARLGTGGGQNSNRAEENN
jgi:hypothetical protein